MDIQTISYETNHEGTAEDWQLLLVNFQIWKLLKDGFKILYNVLATKEIDGKIKHWHNITFAKFDKAIDNM